MLGIEQDRTWYNSHQSWYTLIVWDYSFEKTESVEVEWMVTHFGLSGAPSTFQYYIISVLHGYLDGFYTAYMDNVLIYTCGIKNEPNSKERLVLMRLKEAGLFLGIGKIRFVVKSLKYLGFIIQASIGFQIDPSKFKNFIDWMPPIPTTGVISFFGFANYYQILYRGYLI